VTARLARRIALLLAIPLAFTGAFGAQAAFATSDRPPPPVVVSPTANAIDVSSGGIVATGTGVPGEAVVVDAFPTTATYRSAVKRDQSAYNQYLAGAPQGGYGSGPGPATVNSSGAWTFDVDAATISKDSKAGVTYFAAFEFERGKSAYPYPSSGYGPAVKVYTSWLHNPGPPKFTHLGSNGTVPKQTDGTLLLHGTGVPGALLIGFVDPTRSELTGDFSRFAAQKQTLGTACPTGDVFCATSMVQPNGTWQFIVDAQTVSRNKSGTFFVAAAQAINNGSPDRWSSPSAVHKITVGPAAGSGALAAPSVFSSLAAFKWTTLTPAHVALTAGAALVLTLLLGFPTTLMNSALEASYDARAKRIKRYTDRMARLAQRIRARWKRTTARVPKFVGTIVWFFVAAIISGFADPSFGFSLESLRVLVSLFVTFAVLNVLGAYVTWWATSRSSHTQRPGFPARPSNLVILVVSVIVARLIHLEPGLVFGAVLGLDFGVKLAVHRRVPVVLVGAGYAAVIGLAAWIGYSSIPASSSAFGLVLLREFLSQLAVAGLASLPISLLPFKALSGESLFRWKRVAWAISYAVGLVIFLIVLLPMPFSWSGVSEPLVAWVSLFVAYSIVAALVWLGVRYHWFAERKRPKAQSVR
jgi:hypothetical protein